MAISKWTAIFREAAKAVREVIDPLVGTESAAEPIAMRGDGDVTRRIDYVAEQAAIDVLQQSHESFRLVSEELGVRDFGNVSSGTIVLDPIDGSYNAVHGIPAYSFSVAFAKSRYLQDVCEAVVADLANGVFYEAELRQGARMNGAAIHASRVERISDSTISADLNMVDLRMYLRKIVAVLNMAKRKRYIGTNALEICLVACGKYDAFVDLRGMSRVTDVAAAQLILKEAGGVVVNEEGHEVDIELQPASRLSFVAAANARLCRNILTNLERTPDRSFLANSRPSRD
jgi:myo-inositol-1(or 4)-monophosphatase